MLIHLHHNSQLESKVMQSGQTFKCLHNNQSKGKHGCQPAQEYPSIHPYTISYLLLKVFLDFHFTKPSKIWKSTMSLNLPVYLKAAHTNT